MAYPTVSAPYGFRPVNALGNANFTGTTREYAIPYAYATDIFYGDIVGLTRGRINRLSVTSGTAGTVSGIFMGCYYTDPTTKQTRYSQYWPASTLAAAVAIVADDPNLVFKGVMCSSGTTLASAAAAMIGQNMALLNNTGSTSTGNSANAVAAPTDTPATTSSLPVRVIGLVEDTKNVLGTASYTSISTATVTCSALPAALTVGTEVYSLAANGQMISSGSFVDTAASAGATSFILNQAPAVAFVASSTLVFVQYPEVLLKWNFGQHQYEAGTSIA